MHASDRSAASASGHRGGVRPFLICGPVNRPIDGITRCKHCRGVIMGRPNLKTHLVIQSYREVVPGAADETVRSRLTGGTESIGQWIGF
jgi:hypothetical protein